MLPVFDICKHKRTQNVLTHEHHMCVVDSGLKEKFAKKIDNFSQHLMLSENVVYQYSKALLQASEILFVYSQSETMT